MPVRKDPKDYPAAQMFMHAYHHPDEVRPDHTWVDFFVEFDASDRRTSGLEFVEGLWAEKLVILALIATVAIIAVSVTWCALGGNLQTVFTVMSFVLSLVAGQLERYYTSRRKLLTAIQLRSHLLHSTIRLRFRTDTAGIENK